MLGPTLPLSEKTHQDKYRSEGEVFREAMNRVSHAMTDEDDDEHFYRFREILMRMMFMPGGRVQVAMGSTRYVTAHNCFVSGTIEDNFTEENGIMARANEAAKTMRMGGGIGYDFSTLRPRGDLIKSLQARSSGPVSFMTIYDAVCRCIASAGHRRGAQMAVLRVDHPDVEEFIRAKQKLDTLTGFNISLGITDEFMRAVKAGSYFDLRWDGRVYKTVDAKILWEMIMRSTWDWAEPGVLFIDRINEMNNLYYCENIAATNPCGEQPLPPYGACLLGSFNLTKFVKPKSSIDITSISDTKPKQITEWTFDWQSFINSIPPVVRAMDNVVDRAHYPLEEQKHEAISKRRMGLGITGLANAGEALGFPYGSDEFVEFEEKILSTLAQYCYEASAGLAAEKGAFPLFDKDKYLASEFIKTLPDHTQNMIRDYGIRNSHLLSIAPTGTISLCADNISSGVEPVFSHSYERTVQEFDGAITYQVEDYGARVFGVLGKTTEECSADDHLRVLAAAYKHVDSAVSKTCNVDPNMSWTDFKNIYIKAWETGCKGCTTFNPSGERGGVLVATKKEEPEIKDAPIKSVSELDSVSLSCETDLLTGRRDCDA